VVFDVTNPKTFEAIAEVDQLAEKYRIYQAELIRDSYALEKTIVYIVGNKCDLESERKIPKEKGLDFGSEFSSQKTFNLIFSCCKRIWVFRDISKDSGKCE